MKRDRFERQDDFAGLIHRSNVFLKPARRVNRAQLAVGIDQHWYGVEVCSNHVPNVADIGSAVWVKGIGIAKDAEKNSVIILPGKWWSRAGFAADGDVVATLVEPERSPAKGAVIDPGYVVPECSDTDCGVAARPRCVNDSNVRRRLCCRWTWCR